MPERPQVASPPTAHMSDPAAIFPDHVDYGLRPDANIEGRIAAQFAVDPALRTVGTVTGRISFRKDTP